MASALETTLLMSMESSLGVRVIQLELRVEDLLDILIGKGGKVSAEKVGEEGEEFVCMVKTNRMGAMSKY